MEQPTEAVQRSEAEEHRQRPMLYRRLLHCVYAYPVTYALVPSCHVDLDTNLAPERNTF
jgi:hypothetical protein